MSTDKPLMAFSRYRFADEAETPPLYYDAYGLLEEGCAAAVAVVLIHGWGGHVRAVLPAFMEALRLRAGAPERTPYLIAPMFPRRETLESNHEPDDGRAVWGDSWANEHLHPGSTG